MLITTLNNVSSTGGTTLFNPFNRALRVFSRVHLLKTLTKLAEVFFQFAMAYCNCTWTFWNCKYSYLGYNEVREGHIVLIAPRSSPNEDTQDSSFDQTDVSLQMAERGSQNFESNDLLTWQTVGENLDIKKWGLGPTLGEKAINDVSGFPAGLGCCDWKSRCLCCASFLAFPRHTTGNQFFTPRLFTVYHREGYRACMECDDFLKTPTKNFKHPKLAIHV